MHRLPFSFHRTFIPERVYITAMLTFAAAAKNGTVQEISAQTGIPMGKSCGKTPAILDYCCGMGLVTLTGKRGATKSPRLTSFGRVVFLEDKFLKLPLSQWLAHFHLCRPEAGAEAWFLTFVEGRPILGDLLNPAGVEQFLQRKSGGQLQTSLVGPLFRTYTDAAALLDTGLLAAAEGAPYRRTPAPVSNEFLRGYAAWLLTLIETHFPDQREVAANDLQSASGWQDVGGWTSAQCDSLLSLLQDRGFVDVNRHLRPWVITRLSPSSEVWPTIYQDLV